MRTFSIALLLLLMSSFVSFGSSVLEEVSAGFGIPRGLLLTICERESGPREDKKQILRPKAVHDGGAGSGACGMWMDTASLILGRQVSKLELQSLPFTAVLSARYLTEKRWCGRWKRWEARVLCYRVGHNHRILARIDKMPWQTMPKWWSTYKIFKRWGQLHGGALNVDRVPKKQEG